MAKGERAEANRYEKHIILTAYSATVRPGGMSSDGSSALRVSRVSAFVFPRGIITVRSGDGFDMEEVVRRWDDNHDLLRFSVGALVYGLPDVIVDTHFDAVKRLG